MHEGMRSLEGLYGKGSCMRKVIGIIMWKEMQ